MYNDYTITFKHTDDVQVKLFANKDGSGTVTVQLEYTPIVRRGEVLEANWMRTALKFPVELWKTIIEKAQEGIEENGNNEHAD